MMPDFTTIHYLKDGNDRQQEAFRLLTEYRILEVLKQFDPILTGTIPLNIDLPESDLDISCYMKSEEEFKEVVQREFSTYEGFHCYVNTSFELPAVIATFCIEDTEIELFGQQQPAQAQNAYKHMVIEHQLLQLNGEDFRNKIIALKQQGMKTEPAFAQLLQLPGDPYSSLLELNI